MLGRYIRPGLYLPTECLSVTPQANLIVAAACIVVIYILRQLLSRDIFKILDRDRGRDFIAHCAGSGETGSARKRAERIAPNYVYDRRICVLSRYVMVYLLPPFLLLPAEICHTFPGHVPPLLTAPCLPLDFLHSYQQHSTTRCLQ